MQKLIAIFFLCLWSTISWTGRILPLSPQQMHSTHGNSGHHCCEKTGSNHQEGVCTLHDDDAGNHQQKDCNHNGKDNGPCQNHNGCARVCCQSITLMPPIAVAPIVVSSIFYKPSFQSLSSSLLPSPFIGCDVPPPNLA